MGANTMKNYRVEWMHNGQWRMAENDAETFSTREAAERHLKTLKKKYPKLETRIVDLKAVA